VTNLAAHYVFVGDKLVFAGELAEAAQAVHGLSIARQQKTVIFQADNGSELDLNLRGTAAEVAARYPQAADSAAEPEPGQPTVATQPRKRGRPKLGVVGREVTLLPRHWQWLDTQRGGASAALRRLVDETRKARSGEDAARAAQVRTQRLLTTLAGNEPGFEEALRALYARDAKGFALHTRTLSADVLQVANLWAAAAFAN